MADAFGDDTYFCRINNNCLKEVRFGVRLENEYQEEIQNIVKNLGYNNVLFKKAIINTDDFALSLEEI